MNLCSFEIPWWAYALLALVVLAVAMVYFRSGPGPTQEHLDRVDRAASLLAMTDVPWQSVAARLLLDRPEGALAANAYGTPLSATVPPPPPLPARADADVNLNPVGRRFGRGGKNEERCRQLLQHWFGVPFPTYRPAFLKWKTGRNLELDMYNETMGLAVEYDGIMHRRFHPSFHRTYADFLYQQAKDTWKDERCREVGVTLVRVPDTVHFTDLPGFLLGELRKRGFEVRG